MVKALLLVFPVYLTIVSFRLHLFGFGRAEELIPAGLGLLALARFGWLLRRSRSRGYSGALHVVPFLAVCFVASVAAAPRFDLASERAQALRSAHLASLPKFDRSQLRLALTLAHDMSGIDLRAAQLQGFDLAGKRMRNSDLQFSDLRQADLHGADLRQADLHVSDLRGADLSSSDLRGANLQCAALQGADLRSAKLGGVNVEHAFVSSETTWTTDAPAGADPRSASYSPYECDALP